MSKSLLIVDDELDIQSSLAMALKDEGYTVVTATLPKEAQLILQGQSFDLCLFDVWYPEGDGIELLEWTRKRHPESVVVMMSGHGNIEMALKAVRLGAYDFLEKPLELEKVLLVLNNAAETLALRRRAERLQFQIQKSRVLVGESQPMTRLKEQISKFSASSQSALITGSHGSGKELVAWNLHNQSERRNEPWVAVNCAAVPESLFESEFFGHEKGAFTGAERKLVGRLEQAGRGTLFLDEVAELSLTAQAKLLRVLEERTFERVGGRQTLHFEARVIAATNRDIESEVKSHRFRDDLFFRLNALPIRVPALKDRIEDLPQLVSFFLQELCRQEGRRVVAADPSLITLLAHHDWPGNLRELKNLLERMLLLATETESLSARDLPADFSVTETLETLKPMTLPSGLTGSLRELRARFEKSLIEDRLRTAGGQVSKAAESLGVERTHLHRKMRQYGLTSS